MDLKSGIRVGEFGVIARSGEWGEPTVPGK